MTVKPNIVSFYHGKLLQRIVKTLCWQRFQQIFTMMTKRQIWTEYELIFSDIKLFSNETGPFYQFSLDIEYAFSPPFLLTH